MQFWKKLSIFVLSIVAIVLIVGSVPAGAHAQAELLGVPSNKSQPSEDAAKAASEDSPPKEAASAASRRVEKSEEARIVPPKWVKAMPPVLKVRVLGAAIWKVVTLLIVLLVGMVLRKVAQFILRARLAPVAARFGAKSVSKIVDVFAGPGSTLVVSGLLATVYPQLGLTPGWMMILGLGVRILAILSIVVSLYRLVDVFADGMAAKAEQTESKLDDQLVPLVRKAMKILVILSGVLFLLQNLQVNVGSLVAGLGIGGVAIALAAKDTIANFFGSLMIFVDRPFQIGDWVRIGGTEGVVEEVGFRSTRVRTFYNSLVTVPNAHFTEAAIDNMGLREYRRLSTTLGLTYDTTPDQMQAFVEGIRAIIVANPYTRKDYYEIHFSGFGAHSLDVMLYMFFKVESWTDELREKHNVLLEILRLAKEVGVQFAFPTQTLFVDHVAQPGQTRDLPAQKSRDDMTNVITAFGPGGRLSHPTTSPYTDGYLASTSKKGGGDDG